MTLRLDPRWPLVWRTPTSVQIGIDPPLVILDPVTELEERLLAAIAVGVSESGLSMLARGRDDVCEALVARLEPALEAPAAAAAPVPRWCVAVGGSSPFVPELSALLGGCGIRVQGIDDATIPDLAVVVAHHVISPGLHSYWLRRDVPHLPVVFTDRAVLLGPLVEPGAGPCLLCLELHRRDADPAWPAIASQLLGREGSSESPLTGREAVAAVARLVVNRLTDGPMAPGRSLRIDAATGERTERSWSAHPECGCRGIAHLVAVASPAPR